MSMRKYLYLFATILAFSCCDDSDEKEPSQEKFSTPDLSLITQEGSSFNGVVEVYPCDAYTTGYVGNYKGRPPALEIFPATYIFGETGLIKAIPPILLPIGPYTLIYWGIPQSTFPTYATPASNGPALSFSEEAKNVLISMRPINQGGTIFRPIYDYVWGRQDIHIGSDELTVNMTRVTGGLIIKMVNNDGTALDAAIKTISVEIKNIAKSVNFYTGVPLDYTATVRFPLSISTDRLTAQNNAAMLLPSMPTTPASLVVSITLNDGTIKTYEQELTKPILAGNILTIDIKLGTLITTPPVGEITVEGWTESQETITTGN